MGLFGGKNSFFNKPLGTGSGSANTFVENVIGKEAKKVTDTVAGAGVGMAAGGPAGAIVGSGLAKDVFSGGAANAPADQLSKGDIEGYMNKGRARGEELTGTTSAEVGTGRADVRDRLQQTLEGNSAGATAMKMDANANMKELKAQQMMSGGGQMNIGQQQALKRQGDLDQAKFVSDEKRQALSDLSREWRGAGSDIMKSEGQYGSILVGSQSPAMPAQSNSLFDKVFGGIF